MTTRAEMTDALRLARTAPTKTYVVEVHTEDRVRCLADICGDAHLTRTDDAFLFKIAKEDGVLWVDQLDQRFWCFHTDMPTAAAHAFLRARVESRPDLDWMWLPSQQLHDIWPGSATRRVHTDFRGRSFLGDDVAARDLKVDLSGQDAGALLEYIARDERYRSAVSFESVSTTVTDDAFGTVDEDIDRQGRFLVHGDSPELHMQFVGRVVDRYSSFVTLLERKAISWEGFPGGGGIFTGAPVLVELSRPITDLEAFLRELLSSRKPFRLWGLPTVDAGTAHVAAVDLHVGDIIRLDVTERSIVVHLAAQSCGNTVARLLSNLQHYYDGALRLADSELQAAMEGRAPDWEARESRITTTGTALGLG